MRRSLRFPVPALALFAGLCIGLLPTMAPQPATAQQPVPVRVEPTCDLGAPYTTVLRPYVNSQGAVDMNTTLEVHMRVCNKSGSQISDRPFSIDGISRNFASRGQADAFFQSIRRLSAALTASQLAAPPLTLINSLELRNALAVVLENGTMTEEEIQGLYLELSTLDLKPKE